MLDSKRYYLLVANLVHPAFLGAVLVGLVNQVRDWAAQEPSFHFTLSVLGSIVLVVYFVCDYLVLLEHGSNSYKSEEFPFDVAVLVVFLLAFHAVWDGQFDDFFRYTFAIAALYLLKDLLVAGKNKNGDYRCGLWCVFGATLSFAILSPAFPHIVFIQYIGLAGLIVIAGCYLVYATG